jgi:hypothetical protein
MEELDKRITAAAEAVRLVLAKITTEQEKVARSERRLEECRGKCSEKLQEQEAQFYRDEVARVGDEWKVLQENMVDLRKERDILRKIEYDLLQEKMNLTEKLEITGMPNYVLNHSLLSIDF